MKHRFLKNILMPVLLLTCLTLCSCEAEENHASSKNNYIPASSREDIGNSSYSAENLSADETSVSSSEAVSEGLRGSTPTILIGTADGITTYGNDYVTIDASHTSEGYIMVDYCGTNPIVKLQITGSDDVTYTYNLHGGYETFPLTCGSGSYILGVYENIEGTSYSTLFTQSIDVTITNEFGSFLYANQYVNFSADSSAVELGCTLAAPSDNDIEVIENVYNYIITNFTYDFDKAANVQKGYLPVVDEICAKNTGICFDYAAVTAAMLRTQNIPTRLEVGYIGDVYHAWISTYISEKGWINGIIQFDGNEWKLLDPTFASTSDSPKEFLTETDEYITKYVY